MKNIRCVTCFIISFLFSSRYMAYCQEVEIDKPIGVRVITDNSFQNQDQTNNQVCDEAADFPNLGPEAPQSCEDVSNPNNKGTLDCRTDASVGGYNNVSNNWGSYKVIGGKIRYNGTKTRVERFFKPISQGINKKTILTGSFRIYDLSDGNTCIMQSHAGGEIIQGAKAGSTNSSAQFLLYAMKTNDNKIKLEMHVTVDPYTKDSRGSREKQDFITLNYNEEYAFTYETGYDASGIAFSKIKVGDTEKYITHTHTTKRVYTRYGAYGTGDTGDVTAHIEFRDVNLCRE